MRQLIVGVLSLRQKKWVQVVGVCLVALLIVTASVLVTANPALAATCKDPGIIYHVQNTWNQQHEWKARVSTSPSNYGKHYKVTTASGQDVSKILTKENMGTGSNYIDYWVSSFWRAYYRLGNNHQVWYWRNC